MLDNVDRVMNRLDRAAKIDAADDGQARFSGLASSAEA
jgi:hypothetical protein